MSMISLGNRKIGKGFPVFIIAEAGVNHNGDLALAYQLIDAAVEAGADAVKFQTFKAKNLVTQTANRAEYQIANTGESDSQFKMLQNLELPFEDFPKLKKYAEERGILFLSTPFDFESLAFLIQMELGLIKISSGDLSNFPFLKKVAAQGIPMIISTGMADLDESRAAVAIIRNQGLKELVVLHCTTNYPCPMAEVNLLAMKTLQETLDCEIGYSDHTEGILVPVLAVAAGACVIEKHFTLDRNMEGPDHKASLEPQELKEMVVRIREVEEIMGSGEKVPFGSEMRIKEAARKSLVSNGFIAKGDLFTEQNVVVKRPGNGIPPMDWEKVIGRKALRNIGADEVITWEMVE